MCLSVCVWVRACVRVCVCRRPSGHPCLALFPVKCCQRGLCGLPWRLEVCCTALPAQAADLRKGNLGRPNGGVAPELFREPSTGPAPPTIFHMRTSVCGACGVPCVCVCEYMHFKDETHFSCWCLQACSGVSQLYKCTSIQCFIEPYYAPLLLMMPLDQCVNLLIINI